MYRTVPPHLQGTKHPCDVIPAGGTHYGFLVFIQDGAEVLDSQPASRNSRGASSVSTKGQMYMQSTTTRRVKTVNGKSDTRENWQTKEIAYCTFRGGPAPPRSNRRKARRASSAPPAQPPFNRSFKAARSKEIVYNKQGAITGRATLKHLTHCKEHQFNA